MNHAPIIHISDRNNIRKWLEENHLIATHAGIHIDRLDMYFLHSDSYIDMVEELLCFGWIDGTVKKRDDGGYMQRISPRTKKYSWTELNKARFMRQHMLGRTVPAGHDAFKRAPQFVQHDETMRAIQNSHAWENFQQLHPLYVRIRLAHIQQALPTTTDKYKKRLDKFIAHTAAGKTYGKWNDNGRLL